MCHVAGTLTDHHSLLFTPSLFSVVPSILFAYEILTPAALNFFVEYSNGAVESLWSIDQYFEFVVGSCMQHSRGVQNACSCSSSSAMSSCC